MKKKRWKECENWHKQKDIERGCKILTTRIGSDYATVCPGENPAFVEVKDGCAPLTPTQKTNKKIANEIGWDYKTKRCNCKKHPLGD